jgi:hypothetical protein
MTRLKVNTNNTERHAYGSPMCFWSSYRKLLVFNITLTHEYSDGN